MRADVVGLGGGGIMSIYATVQRMRALVRKSVGQPVVRFTAVQIVQGIRSDRTQAEAIRRWLEANTRFLRDPRGIEYLHAPAWLLTRGYDRGVIFGDCDDLAMLGAALGMSIGLRARFVVIGREQFEHVYTELGDPSGAEWVELDVSAPAQGIDPSYFNRAMSVEV